ncbi:hypothetical protein QO179_25130 [Bacillus stercoris]|nr:hypothetical protein [Bacillus stercoris]
MSRVFEIVSELASLLNELVDIQEESYEIQKEFTERRNNILHELEIAQLNGGQLAKVASHLRDMSKDRRYHKNEWTLARDFNEQFETKKVIQSCQKAMGNLRKVKNYQEHNLVKDTGVIKDILGLKSASEPKQAVIEVEVPTKELVVK